MKSIDQEIQVGFRYAVHFTTGVFESSNPLLRDVIAVDREGGLFVIDSCCIHTRMPATARRSSFPAASRSRTILGISQEIQRAIHDAGLCRHSYVVAIGGGAVLDVAGYAAATAHRGIRMIRIPTTVLAQDDSGVGVKNGVNAFGKKNYLGTFAPPFAVINDFNFLRTLSDRDWRGGLAEAVKVALIKDSSFFDFIEEKAAALASRDMASMTQTIERCAGLHLAHIASSGDPFELGRLAAARLRALGGAQARAAYRFRAAARRGGRDRNRSRQHVLLSCRLPAGAGLAAHHGLVARARIRAFIRLNCMGSVL